MRRFFDRSGILFTLTFCLYIVSWGCSKSTDSLSIAPVSKSQGRSYHFDPRPNPLQEYIQDTWTNSDPNATGGSHYSHIKIYGHSYTILDAQQHQASADFIAEHFDAYMFGGQLVRTAAEELNEDMLWMMEAANIPHIRAGPTSYWDSLQVDAWLLENPQYSWSDLLLYYKWDVSTWLGEFPGWNPSDDSDGDGCIDSTPSDPNRTAQCMYEARALAWNGEWLKADVASTAYIEFSANEADIMWGSGAEGFHFDVAAYQSESLLLGETFEYEGWSETDPDFPYIEEKIAFVPSVMDIVEGATGPAVAFANMVSTTYICGTSGYYAPQHDYAQAYLENMFLENWLPNLAYANTSRRGQLLECPFLDFLEQGKGIALTYQENTASEQSKLFSLAMFYLINHQMAFYYYTNESHDGRDAENNQWNYWVEYDVGQPTINNLGLDDFLDESGTDRFFVFASGSDPDYEVLGRQYLRSDGKRVLVLAKVMGPNESLGPTTGTSISLGGSYKEVLPDFTLGSTISQITLLNNEGVILVKQAGSGGCHGCGFEG